MLFVLLFIRLKSNAMDKESKDKVVIAAEGISKYLSVDICVTIFGKVLLELHFPPKT